MQLTIIAAAIVAALFVFFDSGKNQSRYYKTAESCSTNLTAVPWTKREEANQQKGI